MIACKVRYPNGKIVDTDAGLELPDSVCEDSNDGFAWQDVLRPFEGDCEILLYTFEHKEGKEVFWHSSAHILGGAMETEFGVHLTHGPPTEDGFFYDAYTGSDKFAESNYKVLEKAAQKQM